MSAENLDKLPKWAKNKIISLQNKNYSLEKELSEFNGFSKTNTYISVGIDKKPLPNNSNIQFKLDENQLNNVSVYIRKDGLLDINTDSRCGKTMVIIPRAANAFFIDFIDK